MKERILANLIALLLRALSPALIRKLIDKMLDQVEEFIADTGTQTDDEILLPLIKMIREAIGIPDTNP